MALNPLSSVRPEQPVAVYLGASFAALTLRTDVFARSVRRALSPGTDQAELVSDYGRLARPGAPWANVPPLTLRDQCCEVRVTVAATEHVIFRGLVTADVLQPAGTFTLLGGVQVPNGQVRHTCRGVDWLLERIYPHQSVTAAYGAVQELFSFNGRSTPMERNCSAAALSGWGGTSRLFDWTATATLWTARAILEYLLRFASAQTGYTWTLAGEAASLDTVTPQIDPRGKSLRQLVQECIRPQDGFAARYSVDGTSATITVVSLSDVPILDLDGAVAVPANTDTVSLGSAVDTDRDLSSPVLTPVAESAYSAVEVASEPIRVVAMLGKASGAGNDGLVPAWSASAQNGFDTASDLARGAEHFREVYAEWMLPDDWNGCDADGYNVLPSLDALTCEYSFATPGTAAVPALVFERRVPYAAPGETYQTPALLLLWSGSAWTQPDRAAQDSLATVGLSIADTGPRIRMEARSNVLLAGRSWTGTSDVQPQYDPVTDGFRVTVSFYSHTTLSCRMAGSGSGGTKRVSVPGYHLWLCPAAATWSPGRVIPAGTILRDDRPALKRLTAQLASWYGRVRNTLSYATAVAPGPVMLGKMVAGAYSGGSWSPVGTVVTTETWSWDDRGGFGYQVATDFADLDLSAISRRRVETTERETSRRIARLEERMAALPLREAAQTREPLRPLITWDGSQWTLDAIHWPVTGPGLSTWYSTGTYPHGERLTLPAGTTQARLWVQVARAEWSAGNLTLYLRLASDASGASYRVADATAPNSYLSPQLYVFLGTFRGASGGAATFEPVTSNHGPVILQRLAALYSLPWTWEIHGPGATYALTLRVRAYRWTMTGDWYTSGGAVNLTAAELGSAGTKYIGYRHASDDWGICSADSDLAVCELAWDGVSSPFYMRPYGIPVVPKLANGPSGSFTSADGKTITLVKGVVTAIA